MFSHSASSSTAFRFPLFRRAISRWHRQSFAKYFAAPAASTGDPRAEPTFRYIANPGLPIYVLEVK